MVCGRHFERGRDSMNPINHAFAPGNEIGRTGFDRACVYAFAINSLSFYLFFKKK